MSVVFDFPGNPSITWIPQLYPRTSNTMSTLRRENTAILEKNNPHQSNQYVIVIDWWYRFSVQPNCAFSRIPHLRFYLMWIYWVLRGTWNIDRRPSVNVLVNDYICILWSSSVVVSRCLVFCRPPEDEGSSALAMEVPPCPKWAFATWRRFVYSDRARPLALRAHSVLQFYCSLLFFRYKGQYMKPPIWIAAATGRRR